RGHHGGSGREPSQVARRSAGAPTRSWAPARPARWAAKPAPGPERARWDCRAMVRTRAPPRRRTTAGRAYAFSMGTACERATHAPRRPSVLALGGKIEGAAQVAGVDVTVAPHPQRWQLIGRFDPLRE